MNPAVFLDRDGVLVREIVRDNQAFAPIDMTEFSLYPNAGTEVQRLKDSGFLCIVFTNQPEIGRGLLPQETLDEMHRVLRAEVPVDDVLTCPHGYDGVCECRKPLPGMLLQAATTWNIDLTHSFVVGDRWRDIGAGLAAGCYSILIERPYSACEQADARVETFAQAVDLILARTEATSS
jgi:D-glycero-D-manno-heptose 1,7-bisphosphate phosphatase